MSEAGYLTNSKSNVWTSVIAEFVISNYMIVLLSDMLRGISFWILLRHFVAADSSFGALSIQIYWRAHLPTSRRYTSLLYMSKRATTPILVT
jgi:hypothetical protein